MKIYISGAITGRDQAAAKAAFSDAETLLTVLGQEAVNPMAKVTEQESLTWEQYMKQGIPLLLKCNAIYLLPDWRTSRGARLEKSIAVELGLMVIYAKQEDESACNGNVYEHKYNDTELERSYRAMGITFRSMKEAAATLKTGWIAERMAFVRLEEAINKINGDWSPDWNNIEQEKWGYDYSHCDKELRVVDVELIQRNRIPAIYDEEKAKKILEEYHDDIKFVLTGGRK